MNAFTNPTSNLAPRATYQFPVYRWIGWLAVVGFALGLVLMFFIAGLFGVPAPLGWAFIVTVFTLLSLLLDRPKMLLGIIMFFFLLIPGNRLFGLIYLPLPGFLDELLFMPLIAVIVMNWIQRRRVAEATLFPILFALVAAMSWYVNGKQSLFVTIQVTLVMLKFYILYYYCRLTSTFESEQQLLNWLWFYIFYIAGQFAYNILWQQGPWPRFHPDRSGGVFGPDSLGQAHLVGYISVLGLFLLAGWWTSRGSRVSRLKRLGILLLTVIIGYNLVFMTDTKHALFVAPIAFLPFLLQPKISMRFRLWLATGGVLFFLATVVYLHITGVGGNIYRVMESAQKTPKGKLAYAVTADFRHLVPYPLLGAGPGRFTSDQARAHRVPLARRYIIPYYDEARRHSYYGRKGSTVVSSVVGSVDVDLFVLMGEFGWLGTALYYWFLGWITWRLFQKSNVAPASSVLSGIYLALTSCILFFMLLTLFVSITTVPVIIYPIWMLIGRTWDVIPETQNPADPPLLERD